MIASTVGLSIRHSNNPFKWLHTVITANVTLWKKTFWDIWDPLPWDAKFAWIYFISNTVALITIIEVLVLR